jgi:predicted nuclease of predicted toxin-antitoxin system
VIPLFADENFPLPVVESLRRLGYDVTTLLDAGLAEQGLPDESVLALAHSQGRALLTINRRDFIHLHNRPTPHAGIIACTQDRDFPGQAARIHAAIGGQSDLAAILIRVNRAP